MRALRFLRLAIHQAVRGAKPAMETAAASTIAASTTTGELLAALLRQALRQRRGPAPEIGRGQRGPAAADRSCALRSTTSFLAIGRGFDGRSEPPSTGTSLATLTVDHIVDRAEASHESYLNYII